MRRFFLIALVGMFFLLGAGTAAAVPPVINGTAPSLHPEGVAWDPGRRALLVSSMRHGTVSVVSAAGRVRTLVNEPRIVSSFGVHVDVARNRLLVAYADIGFGERSEPGQSGVGIFDLTSGRTLRLVPVGKAVNDLAIDSFGNAYVTDPASDTIYRVDTAGRASALVKDPRLASSTIGMNGIVWHPGGYLLAVRYDNGKLLRISLGGHLEEVRVDRPLVGGDGMALRPDGSLVVVTNSLGAPGIDAVTVLRPHDQWRSAQSTVTPWPVKSPTTVAVTSHGSYVVSGRLEKLIHEGTTSDEFVLRRL